MAAPSPITRSWAGGRPRRLSPEPCQEVIASWSRDGRWIYFIPAPVRGVTSVQFFDFTSGKGTPIAKLDRPLYLGLSVSPDGRTLLYSQQDLTGSGLMLVENFR